MAASKAGIKNNLSRLKGSLKKCGFECWRYFFNGINERTGDEQEFLIELIIENPAISADKPLLFQKPEIRISPESLQDALSGNIPLKQEVDSPQSFPSFAAVRVGMFGKSAKQINRFYSPSAFSAETNYFFIKLGDCSFTENQLEGNVFFTKEDTRSFPEFMSDVGAIEWNLHYELYDDFSKCKEKNAETFLVTGCSTVFSGRITVDGKVFVVSPDTSYGYTDKNWGKTLSVPFFHISSSHLISFFTGKELEKSGFALQGNQNSGLFVMSKFEDREYMFGQGKKNAKFEFTSNCSKVPENDDEEKLHWSVSVHNKNYVLDIDVFCSAMGMLVRDYELPEGNKKILKVLTGGNGNGEIRFYKHSKKTLELIEHSTIQNAFCEFGQIEIAE